MIPMAFYAPLKAPSHPNPSGDRALARALIQALELGGFTPSLAATLRTLDLQGNIQHQADIQNQADAIIPSLIAQGRTAQWRVWLTYHNYYKAPDLLGPAVASALNIPYIQVESTRARKRLVGPWAGFAQAAEDAAEAAQAIFYFTKRDAIALFDYAPKGQSLVHLLPFLNQSDLPPASTLNGPILSAAMMRPGDKMESYRLIAQTLALVETNWTLDIAGDGACRTALQDMMQPFGAKVRFLGELGPDGMAEAYAKARLLFWPGVNEAIGLTYLEAQAAGIPVLAQNRPGLRDVLPPDHTCPLPDAGPEGLAKALTQMLNKPANPEKLRNRIRKDHLLPSAAQTISRTLKGLIK